MALMTLTISWNEKTKKNTMKLKELSFLLGERERERCGEQIRIKWEIERERGRQEIERGGEKMEK